MIWLLCMPFHVIIYITTVVIRIGHHSEGGSVVAKYATKSSLSSSSLSLELCLNGGGTSKKPSRWKRAVLKEMYLVRENKERQGAITIREKPNKGNGIEDPT